jgi:hypothetical protein
MYGLKVSYRKQPQRTKRNLLNKRIKNSAESFRYPSCAVTLNRTHVNTQNFTKSAKQENFIAETKTYFSNEIVTQGIFLNNFLIVYVKLQNIAEEKYMQILNVYQ